MKKHIKGWDIGFVYKDYTYDCLIEGGVSKGLNVEIINWSKGILKRLGHDEVDCVNVFEDYKKEGILKPVRVVFEILQYEPQIKAYVITFCDYDESTENLIERIIESSELKTVEWDW